MNRFISCVTFLAALGMPTCAHAQFSTIYTFLGGASGEYPSSLLVTGSQSVLLGTAGAGGFSPCAGFHAGCGVAFSLAPPAQNGGAWTEMVLYTFQGSSDGAGPNSSYLHHGLLVFEFPELGGLHHHYERAVKARARLLLKKRKPAA